MNSPRRLRPPRMNLWARAEYARLNAAQGILAASHTDVLVERDIPVPGGDGVTLLTDHWMPAADPLGSVVLIRTPYGRTGATAAARVMAERGHHVVVQSCRGTFGSGKEAFDPFHHEAEDGRATLDWVRAQPWATGAIHSWGFSYGGLTQWALCDEPDGPNRMTIGLSSRRFDDAIMYQGGGFAVETMLTWMIALDAQERSPLSRLLRIALAKRRLRRASLAIPLKDADLFAVGHRFPPYQDWLENRTPDDSFWQPLHFAKDLQLVPPVTLLAGWQDLFLVGVFDDYLALREAGRPVRLVVGDWTHNGPGAGVIAVDDLLRGFAEISADEPPAAAVRVEVTGGGGWRDIARWPPPSTEREWALTAEFGLAETEIDKFGPGSTATLSYRYDPHDPTPQAGGRSLNPFDSGRRDQRRRELRDDVLVFTSDPLASELTTIGEIRVRLALTSDNPGFDVFLRVCDVDPKGKSHTVSDVYLRAPAASDAAGGLLEIVFPPSAHRFGIGQRLRLQVSSGAHPLHLRNSGMADPVEDLAELRPSMQRLVVGDVAISALILREVR